MSYIFKMIFETVSLIDNKKYAVLVNRKTKTILFTENANEAFNLAPTVLIDEPNIVGSIAKIDGYRWPNYAPPEHVTILENAIDGTNEIEKKELLEALCRKL